MMHADGTCKPCLISTYPSGLVISEDAMQRALSIAPAQSQFASLAGRLSPEEYTNTEDACTDCLPTPTEVNPFSSADIFDFLAFNRAKLQFLDGGSHTFDIQSNGGFSAAAVVKFEGEPVVWERVFDFNNGYPGNNIMLSRNDGSTGLVVRILNGVDWSSECRVTLPGIIVQGSWLAIMTRYRASSGILDLRVGESYASTICTVIQRNRVFTHTFIAKSIWSNDFFFHGSIAGFFAVDTYLHTTQMESAVLAIKTNEDILVHARCKACPANTESEVGSVAVSDCECVSGSVGSSGRLVPWDAMPGPTLSWVRFLANTRVCRVLLELTRPILEQDPVRIVRKGNSAMRQGV